MKAKCPVRNPVYNTQLSDIANVLHDVTVAQAFASLFV